jgi:hypothetical protein
MSEVTGSAIVHPWYRQFYLRRSDAEWCADQVSDDGYVQGLEAIDGFVYVGTTMYGSPTEVAIHLHATDPGPNPAADRLAESMLTGEGGDLDVHNWEAGDPPVATVSLPRGALRLRASWFGMREAAAHPDVDLGGTARSPERIVIDLWPVP